ncbi:MAG: hypothetical protein JNL55_23875 [Steroidobacter sp.]|nr:hypothetical protein [Steroidobacter sp.]
MTPSCEFVAPIRRSKEVKAVCAALRALVDRGELRAFHEGKLRVGRMHIDLEWPDGRLSRLRIDIESATLTFAGFLEAGAGSALYRDLKGLLRAAQAPSRDTVRIDPARAMLRVTEQAGTVSLSIIVTRGEYEYCARRLIELAREAVALAPEASFRTTSHPPLYA